MATSQATNESPTSQGPHGHPSLTYTGFYKRGCRCSECVCARRRYHLEYIKRRKIEDPDYQRKTWEKLKASKKGSEGIAKRRKEQASCPDEAKRQLAKSAKKAVDRRAVLNSLKTIAGCKDCGYKDHPVALDFDHISNDKVRNVATMGTFSMSKIMDEVAKCEVVCLRCHRIRTRNRILAGQSKWASRKVEQPTIRQAQSHALRDRGREFVANRKRESGCCDCGYASNPEAMDFDHVRGEKSFNISTCLHYSLKRLNEEIAKCEVVCANCHRIRTYKRRGTM